jgi:N-methylhydantoinase A
LVGVDVGGTFTDVVAIDGDTLTAVKVPTDVHASERSVLQGAEEVLVGDAKVFNLASTAGLNAVDKGEASSEPERATSGFLTFGEVGT